MEPSTQMISSHDFSNFWKAFFTLFSFHRAVASMTPFIPVNPKYNMLQAIQAKPGIMQYMLYFQDEVRIHATEQHSTFNKIIEPRASRVGGWVGGWVREQASEGVSGWVSK